jgi:hypothetical protein
MANAPKNQKILQIPFTIWILGGMSLLLNASSIMIFSLSPLYLTQVFGLAALYLGVLEGGVEFCSWTMRVFSGALSDYLSKRKAVLFSQASDFMGIVRKPRNVMMSSMWNFCNMMYITLKLRICFIILMCFH